MEQSPSSPGRSPELPSVSPPSTGETIGSVPSTERQADTLPERQEQRGESAPAAEQAPLAPPITPVYTPTAPVASDDDATTQPIVTPPSAAKDDDLIETEWVDKAKKIIAATKDDPYKRELEVSKLQADYLQKRYGRATGSSQ